MTNPAEMTYARSTRWAMAVARGAAAPTASDGARLHSAASIGLMPSTDWRYWVVKKAEPIIANAASEFRPIPAAKPGPRNSSRLIIGSSTVRWRRTKSAATSEADGDRAGRCARSRPWAALSLTP